MSSSLQVRRAATALVKAHNFSPKAIISTIFGDMIVPHGGSVWLGSLVELDRVDMRRAIEIVAPRRRHADDGAVRRAQARLEQCLLVS
jgi:DNA-binding transcriptional regulator PaaX